MAHEKLRVMESPAAVSCRQASGQTAVWGNGFGRAEG